MEHIQHGDGCYILIQNHQIVGVGNQFDGVWYNQAFSTRMVRIRQSINLAIYLQPQIGTSLRATLRRYARFNRIEIVQVGLCALDTLHRLSRCRCLVARITAQSSESIS